MLVPDKALTESAAAPTNCSPRSRGLRLQKGCCSVCDLSSSCVSLGPAASSRGFRFLVRRHMLLLPWSLTRSTMQWPCHHSKHDLVALSMSQSTCGGSVQVTKHGMMALTMSLICSFLRQPLQWLSIRGGLFFRDPWVLLGTAHSACHSASWAV